MKNPIRAILFIIVGIVAICFAVNIADAGVGSYVMTHSYGGDAYTGIQNAAAETGQNVKDLAELIRKGFQFLFWIWGLTMIASGISSFISVSVKVTKEENGSGQPKVTVDKNVVGECAN